MPPSRWDARRNTGTFPPVRQMSRALLALLLLAVLSGCPPASSPPCDTDAECPEGRCRLRGVWARCVWTTPIAPAGQACAVGPAPARPECAAATDCAQGFSLHGGPVPVRLGLRRARPTRCAARAGATDASGARATGLPVRPALRGDPGRLSARLCHRRELRVRAWTPRWPALLYVCQGGACLRRCLNDASCGGQGLICEAGLCASADCATLADCPSGQYCTSATTGRAWSTARASLLASAPRTRTAAPSPRAAVRRGSTARQQICQELPRCLIDTDCTAPALLPGGVLPALDACATGGPCPAGQLCVGAAVRAREAAEATPIVPRARRARTAPAARRPAASEISTLAISPRAAMLVVGGSVQLSLVAFTCTGRELPVHLSGSFTVVDASGAPSDAATVAPSGDVTAVRAGAVRVRAGVAGAAVTPVEATLTILPALAEGRRVTVVDASTGRPLSGVEVLGCDAPPADAPCPAPVTVTTDAQRHGLLPLLDGQHRELLRGLARAARGRLPALRPRLGGGHEREGRAAPARREPGARGRGLQRGHPVLRGPLHRPAVARLLACCPPETCRTWISPRCWARPFFVTVPGLPQAVPVPGSTVAYAASGFGTPRGAQGRARWGSGSQGGGRRGGLRGADRARPVAANLGSTDLLAYTGAMDYALQAFTAVPPPPRVPDTTDLDGDGRAADTSRCPQGPEDVPDYFNLPGFSHRPRREQSRRTRGGVAPAACRAGHGGGRASWSSPPRRASCPLGLSSRSRERPGSGRHPAGGPGAAPQRRPLWREWRPVHRESGCSPRGSPRPEATPRAASSRASPCRPGVVHSRLPPGASGGLRGGAAAPSRPRRRSWTPWPRRGPSWPASPSPAPEGRHVVLLPLDGGAGSRSVCRTPRPGRSGPGEPGVSDRRVVAMDLSARTTPADSWTSEEPTCWG